VDQDIRLLGEELEELGKKIEEWRKLLKKARAHTGMSNQ
jgi:5-bromo-4-chloroindolyl phosphate hydrolysis protein